MKLRVKQMFITVVSLLFLTVFSCGDTEKPRITRLEVNRYVDIPYSENQIIRMAITETESGLLVEKYYTSTIVKSISDRATTINQIIGELELGSIDENSFLYVDGALLKSLTLDIDGVISYVDKSLNIYKKSKVEYVRLYNKPFNDAQVGYLEFIWSSYKSEIDNNDSHDVKLKLIDRFDASILSDDVMHFEISLFQNPDGLFKLRSSKEESVFFEFER